VESGRIRRSAGRRHQSPRPLLPLHVKDFQFRHEHFHLFQSDEALPHFRLYLSYLRTDCLVEGICLRAAEYFLCVG